MRDGVKKRDVNDNREFKSLGPQALGDGAAAARKGRNDSQKPNKKRAWKSFETLSIYEFVIIRTVHNWFYQVSLFDLIFLFFFRLYVIFISFFPSLATSIHRSSIALCVFFLGHSFSPSCQRLCFCVYVLLIFINRQNILYVPRRMRHSLTPLFYYFHSSSSFLSFDLSQSHRG